jgi:Phage integrase family
MRSGCGAISSKPTFGGSRPSRSRATKGGTRTDLGRSAPGAKLAPNPRDPLYFETATTLPVDFHSFRRAFASALAEAGVNVQHAMHLTAHSDPRVHARYVMRTSAMRTIPEAAIPRLGPGPLVARHGQDLSRSIEGSDAVRIVMTSDDSLKSDGQAEGANALSLRHSLVRLAPAAGLETARSVGLARNY